MTTRPDDDPTDEELLALVAEHFAVSDPPPAAVLADAKAIAHVTRLDEELAELLEDAALAGVRSTTQELLRFRAAALTIELRPPEAGADRLVGQVLGGASEPPVTVIIEGPDHRDETTVDEDGFFQFERVPRGPVRLRVHPADAAPVRTVWFTL